MRRNFRCKDILDVEKLCRISCFVAIYALSMWRKITARMLSVEKK